VLADVSTYTGILTLASMVVSRLVFQHLGWGVAASVTPAVMGLAGAVFFGATLLGTGALGAMLPEQATAAMVGVGGVAGIVTQVRGLIFVGLVRGGGGGWKEGFWAVMIAARTQPFQHRYLPSTDRITPPTAPSPPPPPGVCALLQVQPL